MRILLTGTAGFIGSNLAERLLADGHTVIGVDNLITGRRENLAAFEGKPRFEFVEADIAEPLSLNGSRPNLDWILHFASPASPPKYLAAPVETLRANAEGTRLLLDLAQETSASFVLASTSEVYGDPLVHPQCETYWGNVNPIGPRSVYDEGKRYAEAITTAYRRTRRVDARIIRIFNTYGPRMAPHDGRVVTNFIRQALERKPLTVYGDGGQTRSFQYVDDLIEAIVRLLPTTHPGPINLGNPEEFTVLELAQLALELTGSESAIVFEPLPADDPRQRRPEISLARELLGWQPRVPLRDGLALTIDHFRRERMKVLVTGGARYIDGRAAKAFAEAGAEPVVLDDLRAGFRQSAR